MSAVVGRAFYAIEAAFITDVDVTYFRPVNESMPGKEAGVFEEGEGVVVETGRWGSPKIPEAPTGNYRFEDVVWPGPIRSDGGEDVRGKRLNH
ncbi:hypothetical protein MTO96_023598 [Rhipicephalus appendiculatus]